MLYQYAITPDAFDSSCINDMNPKGVVIEQLLRGIKHNGLLADLNRGKWMTAVRRCLACPTMDAEAKKEIETCLTLLYDRNRLIKHPAGATELAGDDFCWLHWAHQCSQSQPDLIHGIFASDTYLELSELTDPKFVSLSQALRSNCWQQRKNSESFEKTESEVRKLLAPIVRYAQKLYLVDPYLSCNKASFMRTVEVCAELLGLFDGQRHPQRIEIHAGDPMNDSAQEHRQTKDARLAQWVTELQPIATRSGHMFKVSLWKQKKDGKKFHDRYIITDQFGVSAPGGLDCFPDGSEARANLSTWNLLEHEQARKILSADLHYQKSPYQYLGSKEVHP
jgi:hypothetical protein